MNQIFELIHPPCQSIRGCIPADEDGAPASDTLELWNQSTDASTDQAWKAPDIALGDGRVLVLENIGCIEQIRNQEKSWQVGAGELCSLILKIHHEPPLQPMPNGKIGPTRQRQGSVSTLCLHHSSFRSAAPRFWAGSPPLKQKISMSRIPLIFGFRIHEATFTLTGSGAFIALLLSSGQHSSLNSETGIGVFIYFGSILLLSRKGGLVRERIRLLVNFMFTYWFYGVTSRVTDALGMGGSTYDKPLLACDKFLFGETPAIALERAFSVWQTDVLSICYLSYLIYLFIVLIWGAYQNQRVIQRYSISIFAGSASGYLTYLFLPALGPGVAFPGMFSTPIRGGILTSINDAVISRSNALYGTFPSLHLLMTLLMLYNDWRDCRWRYWVMLGPAVGLIIATVYLRYHYATDLLFGLLYFLVICAYCNSISGRE